MSTYFSSDIKIIPVLAVDLDLALIAPPSGNGTYNVYTCPSNKFALFQLLRTNVTGSGALSTDISAKTRAALYTGLKTLIKSLASNPSFGIINYAAQLTPNAVNYNSFAIPQLDPFTYLRTLDSMLEQAASNNYCALLGPGDNVEAITAGYDPDNALYLSFRAYEISI